MKKQLNPLPKIDGAELIRLARTGVTAEAENLRLELKRAVSALSPASIVALALSRAPDQSAAVALQLFKDKATELMGMLSAASEEMEAAQRAEQDRLAPLVAAAAHRSLEIVGAVKLIDSTVSNGQLRNESKREELRKLGLTGDKLDAAEAPCDFSDLQAQRGALLAEQAALEAFLKKRDTQHLPLALVHDFRGAA